MNAHVGAAREVLTFVSAVYCHREHVFGPGVSMPPLLNPAVDQAVHVRIKPLYRLQQAVTTGGGAPALSLVDGSFAQDLRHLSNLRFYRLSRLGHQLAAARFFLLVSLKIGQLYFISVALHPF
jgi:hypothetical protein